MSRRVPPAAVLLGTPDEVEAQFYEALQQGDIEKLALHHLRERLEIATDQGPQTAWVLATNVYLKTALGWRLAAHHASPGTPHEPPAHDGKGGGQIGGAGGNGPSTLH